MQQRGFLIRAMSLIAVGFGLLTIKEGGAILFGGEAAQASAGNFVPFVLWFNFLAGFAYVIAGAGLWLRHRWGGVAGRRHRRSDCICPCGIRRARLCRRGL